MDKPSHFVRSLLKIQFVVGIHGSDPGYFIFHFCVSGYDVCLEQDGGDVGMRGSSYNFCRQQVYDFDLCVCVSDSDSGCMPVSHACSGCLLSKVVIA